MHPTGQAIGLVAGGASVQVSGDGSVVANQASALTKKGEEIRTAPVEAGAATVNVEHAAWASVPASATSIAVTNDGTTGYVKEMHMTVQPAAEGLTVSGVTWEAGAAPVFADDTKYIVRLRQIGSDVFGAVEASKQQVYQLTTSVTELQDGCINGEQ